MKKQLFLLLVVLGLHNTSFGQSTINIVEYYQNTNSIKDSTSVLADNTFIKHGRYVLYFNEPQFAHPWIKTEGYYYNNIKDSVWITYRELSSNGGKYLQMFKEEHYNKGKKIGVWKTAVDKFVYERYDYDKKKKLFPDIVTVSPDYPYEASENRLEGTVRLRILYNNDYSIQSIESLLPADSLFIRASIKSAQYRAKMLQKYALSYTDSVITKEEINFNFILNGSKE